MMGCLGKNHNQSETIMQNYVCQSPSERRSEGMRDSSNESGNENSLL